MRERLGGWTYVLVGCAVVVLAEVIGHALSLTEVVVTEDGPDASPAPADRPSAPAPARSR
ncbi:hypothetical protein NS184_02210 [Curtobacterium luteum]|uniref:Uncharacterized protein n=1 Tax=Curtobacterium luteum TaxID=33881 RepID=A0A175S1A2_9MICO|nr:hypothetical protein NS184_02210 [Curtobacterium luteum]